jgi:SAM-dependent methyltransferase
MSKIVNKSILCEVASYYSEKLAQHGETPQGVDWNGEDSQTLRFEQLSKIVNTANQFSIHDLGCGYGAFYEFLTRKHESFSYSGIDVSESMIHAAEQRYKNIHAAEQRYKNKIQVSFFASSEPDQVADYGVASGIFNVRLNRTDEEWRTYLEAALDVLDRTSSKGFAFNCLTSYSDADKMRDYLYYADPCALFDLCKRKYSRNVALLHDYGLYEFTILVRKQP